MQAHRGKQFVSDRSVIVLTAIGIVVVGLTLLVTLALSGHLPTFQRTAAEPAEASSAAVNLPQDRTSIGASEARQWSVGDAYNPALGEGWIGSGVLEQGASSGARGSDRADEMTRLQTSGLGEQVAPGPGEGLNNHRFIEENTQLPASEPRPVVLGEGLLEH